MQIESGLVSLLCVWFRHMFGLKLVNSVDSGWTLSAKSDLFEQSDPFEIEILFARPKTSAQLSCCPGISRFTPETRVWFSATTENFLFFPQYSFQLKIELSLTRLAT